MSSKDTPAKVESKKSRFNMIYMLYVIPAFFFFLPIGIDLAIQFMNWFVFPSGITRQEADLEESVTRNSLPFICDIIWKASTLVITMYIVIRHTSADKTSTKEARK